MVTTEERLTYDIPDAARVLGIGMTLLREEIGKGAIPVVRIGSRV